MDEANRQDRPPAGQQWKSRAALLVVAVIAAVVTAVAVSVAVDQIARLF